MSEETVEDLRTQLADARAFQAELARLISVRKEEAFDAGYELGFAEARTGNYTAERDRPYRANALVPLLECDSCKDRTPSSLVPERSKCPSCVNGHWRATTRACPKCGVVIPAYCETHEGCRDTPPADDTKPAGSTGAPA